MGQRISIKVLDLLNAGCTIKQRIIQHPADEIIGHDEVWTECTLTVVFPGVEGSLVCQDTTVGFDFDIFDDLLMVSADYNEWGTLKPLLDPILERLKIDHTVC